MTETNKEQLMFEVQLLNQELMQVSEHMKQVQEQLQELALTEETIVELPQMKKDNEILIPLASGIFARATIIDTKNTIINAGAQVFVEQPLEKTQELIAEQKEKLEEYLTRLSMQFQQMYARMQEIQQAVAE